MKNISKLVKRLQKITPSHIKPEFTTGEELLAWQKEQGKIYSLDVKKKNIAIKIKKSFNCSGIHPLYKNCSFENYKVECQGQFNAINQARQYAEEFENKISSFIFSGKPGTGKNHLAVAICKQLLLKGKSVLIITVSNIMSAMKNTFNNREISEENLITNLSNVDLLVIDEIGIQIESQYEKVIINQIIDRRSSYKRPTGLLTNCNIKEMTRFLGERVIDRIKLGNSLYITFNWNSYRSRVTGKE